MRGAVNLFLAISSAMALPCAAQMPTGTVSGRVTADDAAMPGVTVTAVQVPQFCDPEIPSFFGRKIRTTTLPGPLNAQLSGNDLRANIGTEGGPRPTLRRTHRLRGFVASAHLQSPSPPAIRQAMPLEATESGDRVDELSRE